MSSRNTDGFLDAFMKAKGIAPARKEDLRDVFGSLDEFEAGREPGRIAELEAALEEANERIVTLEEHEGAATKRAADLEDVLGRAGEERERILRRKGTDAVDDLAVRLNAAEHALVSRDKDARRRLKILDKLNRIEGIEDAEPVALALESELRSFAAELAASEKIAVDDFVPVDFLFDCHGGADYFFVEAEVHGKSVSIPWGKKGDLSVLTVPVKASAIPIPAVEDPQEEPEADE